MARAATFSSLTSNTTVTDPTAVWSYAVFFTLTWHLWATQTAYDLKYYTNDWWHRALFASQLGVYAALSAFSGSFNIGWELSHDAMNPFTGNNTKLTGRAIRESQIQSMEKSFIGINIILFISRMLLLAQYLRVIWYRHNCKQFWSWRLALLPASTFMAACLFLTNFVLIETRPRNQELATTQLVLWTLAIVVQILGEALTPEDRPNTLKSKSTLAPRLSSLTVIIMGEGLNGICGTLQNALKSLVLTKEIVAQAIAMLLVLYLLWLLYFDGFRVRSKRKQLVEKTWLWLHLPFHLSLIMMLEGIKNIFIFVNLMDAGTALAYAYSDLIFSFVDKSVWPKHPLIEQLLLPLKISWQEERQQLMNTDLIDDTGITSAADLTRWFVSAFHSIYLTASDQPDPRGEYLLNTYVSKNDTSIAKDAVNGDARHMLAFRQPYGVRMLYTGHWLIPVAGVLLICLAVLNVMRSQPRNRFAWGYCLNRVALGSSLIVIGGTSRIWIEVFWWYWIIPTIAVFYGAASILDWFILYRSICSISKKEVGGEGRIEYRNISRTLLDDSIQGGSKPSGRSRLRSQRSGPAVNVDIYMGSRTGRQSPECLHATQKVFDRSAEVGVTSYPAYHLHQTDPGGDVAQPLLSDDMGNHIARPLN